MIKEGVPQIRQFNYTPGNEEDRGACLWATFIIDCAAYTLTIESDCGRYGYGWKPTPDKERFIHLLSRLDKEYLLCKLADKSVFNIDASIKETVRAIRDCFDGENDAELERAIKRIETLKVFERYSNSFYYDCDAILGTTSLSDCRFEIIQIVKEYKTGAVTIADIFINELQPLLKQEAKREDDKKKASVKEKE